MCACVCARASVGSVQEYERTIARREQDRQCTYNVTLRCVRETIVAVEKQ